METGLRRLGRRDLPTVPIALQTAGVDATSLDDSKLLADGGAG